MDSFPIKGKMVNHFEVNPIIGYKIFNPDWTCRGFKYEVGKTYEMPEQPRICSNGFHFCREMIDLFKYYLFNPRNKIAKVKAYGAIDSYNSLLSDSKLCTNKIEIVEEVKWGEVLRLLHADNNGNIGNSNTGSNNFGSFNTGNGNIGNNNSGDYNCGDYNTGNSNYGNGNIKNNNYGYGNNGICNWGNRNFGNYNDGDGNVGYCNYGDFNHGDNNIGNSNHGNNNIGNRNIGDFNIGDYYYGSFNTIMEPGCLRIFNKPIDYDTYIDEWVDSNIRDVLLRNLHSTWWVDFNNHDITVYTNPQIALCIGGELYPKTKEKYFKDNLIFYNTEYLDLMKNAIPDLPNFDKEIFRQCTGIDI